MGGQSGSPLAEDSALPRVAAKSVHRWLLDLVRTLGGVTRPRSGRRASSGLVKSVVGPGDEEV